MTNAQNLIVLLEDKGGLKVPQFCVLLSMYVMWSHVRFEDKTN